MPMMYSVSDGPKLKYEDAKKSSAKPNTNAHIAIHNVNAAKTVINLVSFFINVLLNYVL